MKCVCKSCMNVVELSEPKYDSMSYSFGEENVLNVELILLCMN